MSLSTIVPITLTLCLFIYIYFYLFMQFYLLGMQLSRTHGERKKAKDEAREGDRVAMSQK